MSPRLPAAVEERVKCHRDFRLSPRCQKRGGSLPPRRLVAAAPRGAGEAPLRFPAAVVPRPGRSLAASSAGGARCRAFHL